MVGLFIGEIIGESACMTGGDIIHLPAPLRVSNSQIFLQRALSNSMGIANGLLGSWLLYSPDMLVGEMSLAAVEACWGHSSQVVGELFPPDGDTSVKTFRDLIPLGGKSLSEERTGSVHGALPVFVLGYL